MKRTTLPAQPREPYVEVKRVGRFTYQVTLHNPRSYNGHALPSAVNYWDVLGALRAERKAERELRRYLRQRGYTLTPTIRITSTERTTS